MKPTMSSRYLRPTGVAVGSSPAASGTIRLPNAGEIRCRNAANNGDIMALRVTTGNAIQLGLTSSDAVVIGSGGGEITLGSAASDLGAFATTPTGKQEVSGSRGGNAALESLLAALAAYGLVTDSSSA